MPAEKLSEEQKLWKNRLDRVALAELASAICRQYPKFKAAEFARAVVTREFLELELKDRVNAIAKGLKEFLPEDYAKAVDVLIRTAPSVGMFENWALTAYVEQFGLEHFEESVQALEALTPHGTGEFAIRPFIIMYTQEMLPVLHRWAEDPDEHVRRLAAEGSRPRGVWVAHIEAFKRDPSPVLELLEKLKADRSKYVRTAVANNLNDISKDHPDIVIETALRWKREGNDRTDWIVKHACRSLIKRGDPRVFPIFGFTASPKIRIEEFGAPRNAVIIGETVEIPVKIRSTAATNQRLAIDYRVHYVKKSGRQSVKVFKLAEREIGVGEILELRIRQAFRDLSTRTHYPGRHRVELVVNGQSRAEISFSLKR